VRQRTLVLVKPDGVRRRLVGEVVRRLEAKMLDIVDARIVHIDKELAGRHYEEHREKAFYDDLISFITSGPVWALAVEGEDAVAVVRAMMGATDPKVAGPGTIRGDFGLEVTENIVHGSDSTESAARELALFFPDLA
jgi:nucleoside-diphosphate kinase